MGHLLPGRNGEIEDSSSGKPLPETVVCSRSSGARVSDTSEFSTRARRLVACANGWARKNSPRRPRSEELMDGAATTMIDAAASSPHDRLTMETKVLAHDRDYVAPDGSSIRLLPNATRGGLAHCSLPAGLTIPKRHRSVEEIWSVVQGHGELWRKSAETETTVILEPGLRQRSELQILIVTMPVWPGAEEAQTASGPWVPTVPLAKQRADERILLDASPHWI